MATPESEKKGNPVTGYFRTSIEEIRKVTWPTRSQAVNLTILVVVISLAVTLFIAALDYVLTQGYNALVDLDQDLTTDDMLPTDSSGGFDFSEAGTSDDTTDNKTFDN